MTRRKVLQDLFYDAYGIIEDNGRDSKEGDDRIDQALTALAQIEESERLGIEEIYNILITKLPLREYLSIHSSKLNDLAHAIHEAQERKSKGVSR